MSDAYEAYGLLLSQIWSDDTIPMVVRPAGGGRTGLLHGADRHGHRHLLAPIAASLAVEPSKGDSLEVVDTDVNGRRYLDLICTSDALAHVFASLADQVVRRCETNAEPEFQVLQRTLAEWRQLLKPSPALSEEEARGLFGELFILQKLVPANPGYALDSWSGPEQAEHDFTTPQGDLEVKSSGTEGRSVVISSLHQVDPPTDRPLALVRVHVESSPTGRNIRDMVEELCRAGLLHEELVAKLAGARYVFGGDPDNHRFVVADDPAAWIVNDDFPGLRASDVAEKRRAAIRSVKYTLDLVAAGEPMEQEEFDDYLSRMMSA